MRTAIDLLAGRLPNERLPEEHLRFFERMENEGRFIVHTEIEKGEDEKDDDWLIIRFGEPDAAISPFEVP